MLRNTNRDSKQLCRKEGEKEKSRPGTDNIPKAAFIYSFKSKTFILAVWHFITTHHDWHRLTHMMLSGYTRTIANELQKINPWFLITTKKTKLHISKLLMHCIEKKVCARHNLKRHSKGCWKLTLNSLHSWWWRNKLLLCQFPLAEGRGERVKFIFACTRCTA